MANQRQLIVVVEGTNALGPAWSTILREYLLNIIRRFYWSAYGEVISTMSFPEMALVTFKTRDSRAMIGNSGWTTNLSTYLGWLSCITFSDMGSTEVATAEGLAEALKMLYDPSANSVFTEVHKHCLLVCASDPHPLEASGEQNSGESVQNDYLTNVESLANCFSHLPMTLSIMSPNRLPIWRTIYNAGFNRGPESTDIELDVKHSSYTILLAERFPEARSAFDLPVEDLIYIPGVGIADTTHTSLVSQLLGVPVPQPFAPTTISSDDVSGSSTVGNIPNIANKVLGDAISNHVGSLFKMSSPHQNALNSLSRYVKIWEGTLYGPVRGRGGVLSRLEAFASTSASASLAGDWPSSLEIVRTPAKEYMNDTAQHLMFRHLDDHWFLRGLHKRNLRAVIELPTYILVLETCKEPGCLTGVLIRRP